tara:strand:- start:315 stop:2375 length:2061 start_codon:yes stop_codon:yes gene_type:complete
VEFIDWIIVIIVLAGMIISVNLSKGLMKSVSDFLSAGRTAGRYLISVSSGIAGLGAISIVMYLEMGYEAGFSLAWWGLSQGIIILMLTMSGWVIYRFRSTRCLTLAQFFEKRYSKNFRIFTGIVAFSAGIINFGIFPAVGAQFFISYCNFPESVMGIPVYPLVMIVLLSISLYFVYTGGQIAVIIADFFQGIFATVVLVVVTLYLFFGIDWDQITFSLEPSNISMKQIRFLETDETLFLLANEEKQKQFDDIRERNRNSSRTNPFKTSHVEDFNFWYFLIGIIGIMYGAMSWQGSQAYNSSAKSAHEAKMGSVLAGFRGLPQGLFFLLVPVLLYVFMNHSEYQDIAVSVQSSLNQFETVTLQDQMRGPLILSTVLPVGLLGAFAALMLAAFVSTHDTYLHSWATILVQDVLMPFRKKPFDKDTHLKVLRIAIFGVAVFIFFFSLLFQQNQKIALFFAITAAIFAGGSGAVIIGGLYWKRGTTAGAWSAMIVGATISVSGVLVKQVSAEWLADQGTYAMMKQVLTFIKDINGQEYWALSMGLSAITYIVISLNSKTEPFNLDKLLNRGKYEIEGEAKIVNEDIQLGWKIFLMGPEFTKTDKIIYILNYAWTGLWTLVFFIGTVYNLYNDVSNVAWMSFWKTYLYVHVTVSIFIIFWFTIGGIRDLKDMISRLKTEYRDHQDDGWVSN